MKRLGGWRLSGLIACAAVMILGFVNCSEFQKDQTNSSLAALGEPGGCVAAPTGLRSPKTIDEVTMLINALPKPLSIRCLIENLPRPLKVVSVASTGSAQPSPDVDSPRVFIVRDQLVISVVPDGPARNLVEYGQHVTPSESVKGELTFPINAMISSSSPYAQIKSGGGGTNCALCHSGERPAVTGFKGDAFASAVIEPNNFVRQNAQRMRDVASRCASSSDPYRCEMLRSIFLKGNAVDDELP
jgi:hypothetical protein